MAGYDTKKVSSRGNQEEESEFGLQKAETGDRRLSQNNVASNSGSNDLRTAHSSDFFSGQREGGRDEYNNPSYAPTPRPKSPSRQSFRRTTTQRSPSTTQYTTPSLSSIQPSSSPHYDAPSTRKLVRKRPVYATTLAPSTYAQSIAQQQQFSSPQPLFNQQPQKSFPPQHQQPQQSFSPQHQNFNHRIPPQNRPSSTTTLPPANVPLEYKDEYVEVVRVAPKKNKNRYLPNRPTSAPFPPSTPAQNIQHKDGLVELYNYDAQSTPGFTSQKESQPSKIRNNFSVTEGFREQDFARTNANANNGRITTTTIDYNTVASRGFATSTPAYRNFNSVSYEPEKKNFVAYPGNKQNYFNSPSATPTTTINTTSRPNSPSKLNTVAYNTNIALNTVQPLHFGNDEDDGQYRPPQGEDDGQYRPELYERELLSGAHSLNIAASGNRLPDDQKNGHEKSQSFLKPVVSQTAAPRPFRPAPTPSSAPPPTTTFATEPTYTTTYRAPPTTFNTQRAFDFFQTYTTTSRPNSELTTTQGPIFGSSSNTPAARLSSTAAPRITEQRTNYRAPLPPTSPPVKKPVAPARLPAYNQEVNTKEDGSYDYAYYDSDAGISEYDHVIEEFEKTKDKSRA